MYKDTDLSELFDKWCKNIESETQGIEVVVECQWNLYELSFHIAGFEEGVAIAIHLIQSEFEAYDLMNESSSDESQVSESHSQHNSLTKDSLAKHEEQITSEQLHQFSCRKCNHEWWDYVYLSKPVSKCIYCLRNFKALPQHLEYGVGQFTCSVCGDTFYSECDAMTSFDCWKCDAMTSFDCWKCDFKVSHPIIHPSNKQQVLRHLAPWIKKRFSKPHCSTGGSFVGDDISSSRGHCGPPNNNYYQGPVSDNTYIRNHASLQNLPRYVNLSTNSLPDLRKIGNHEQLYRGSMRQLSTGSLHSFHSYHSG